MLDASAEACREAEKQGLRVVFGNALEERVPLIADLETRKGAIGTLPNEAVNLLFARKARNEYRVPKAYVAIQRGHGSIDPGLVHEGGATVLFGEAADLELWSVRIRRENAHVELWRREDGENSGNGEAISVQLNREVQNSLLPLAISRDGAVAPFDDRTRVAPGDQVYWLVLAEKAADWQPWLEEQGWQRVVAPPTGSEQ